MEWRQSAAGLARDALPETAAAGPHDHFRTTADFPPERFESAVPDVLLNAADLPKPVRSPVLPAIAELAAKLAEPITNAGPIHG